MLDKSLKIFGLDNNFSLDELEEKYKKLLKEFDTKNIEDDLKVVFLEEQVRIREAYQILLKHCHEREKVSSREPKEKTLPVKAGNKKLRNIVFAICAAFVLISLFSIISNPPKKAPPKGDNKEIVDSGEEEKKAIQCKGTIKEGRRCKRKTTNISGYCYDHEKQEEEEEEEEEAEEEEEKEEEVAPEEEVEAEEEEGGDWAEDAPEENEGGAEGGDWEPPRGNMERYMDLIEEGKSHEEAVEIMENKKKEPIIEVRECDCDKKVNLNKYPDCKQLAEKEIANQKKIEEKKQEISTAEQNIKDQEEMIDFSEGAKIEDLVAKLKAFQNMLRTLKKELKELEKRSECKKIQKWKSAFENCIKNNCKQGEQRYNNLKKAPCN